MFKDRGQELFQQFYMTTVIKGFFKGLHVHPYKHDTIFVPYGKICLAIYTEPITYEQSQSISLDINKFEYIELGHDNPKTISYPSKYPHGFWGIEDESIIINYRTPAWTLDDTYQFDITNNNVLNLLTQRYASMN